MVYNVAVIADIHGNLPALRAVIADIQHVSPDQVVVAGDIVGRGPQSRETLEVIARQNWSVILGNHEQFWIDCASGDVPSDWDSGWWAPIRYGLETLDQEMLTWLSQLPTQHVVEIPKAPAIQVVHGSPHQLNEGLYEHSTDEELLEALGHTPYPVVVGAHTHVPLNRHVGDYWALNASSVGAPFNGDARAQYLLLTWDGTSWHAEHRFIDYDVEETLHIWHTTGYWQKGVAAKVFAYELETATFHFWHYVRYCQAENITLNNDASFEQYLQNTNGHHANN